MTLVLTTRGFFSSLLEKAARFLSSYGNNVPNPTLNSFIAQLFFGPHPTSDKTVHVFGIGGIGAGQEFVGKTFFKKELQPSFNVKFHGHSYSEDKQIAYQIRELGNHSQRPDCSVCPENNNQTKNAVLVGHSWGARKGAMQVADQLEQTSFRSMITLDPVHATMDTPASDFPFNNLDYWLNIYQEKPVADQIPQIPFIGHMIRGILGLPRLIDENEHFMASFGGRIGYLNSADQNRSCTDCTHTETKKMLDQWLQSQKTLLPSFRSSPQ